MTGRAAQLRLHRLAAALVGELDRPAALGGRPAIAPAQQRDEHRQQL
jgi:hypothetical protein